MRRPFALAGTVAAALAGLVVPSMEAEKALRMAGEPGSTKANPKQGKWSAEQLRNMAGKRKKGSNK